MRTPDIDIYLRLLESKDFAAYLDALRDKCAIAERELNRPLNKPEDIALHNELVGFIRGIKIAILLPEQQIKTLKEKATKRNE